MARNKKNPSLLPSQYHYPTVEGSLGRVQRFAKAQGIPVGRARRLLEWDLAYTYKNPDGVVSLCSP